MAIKSGFRALGVEGFAAEICSWIYRLLLVDHNKIEAYERMMSGPCSEIGSKIYSGNRTVMGCGVLSIGYVFNTQRRKAN